MSHISGGPHAFPALSPVGVSSHLGRLRAYGDGVGRRVGRGSRKSVFRRIRFIGKNRNLDTPDIAPCVLCTRGVAFSRSFFPVGGMLQMGVESALLVVSVAYVCPPRFPPDPSPISPDHAPGGLSWALASQVLTSKEPASAHFTCTSFCFGDALSCPVGVSSKKGRRKIQQIHRRPLCIR